MDNTGYAIEVDRISKVFEVYKTPQDRLKQFLFGRWRAFHHRFQALTDVSFAVRPGQSVGIIGRNGAGKSTLLQILTGTLQPSSGAVRVRGKVAAVLELGSGFNPEFSGSQNINMYASLFGLSREETDSRFDRIVEFSGLRDFIEQPVKTYSSGMQARLAFSVIAHVDADILIVDEALSVGDAVFTQKCMRFLREFQERGTILFVSHDMGAVTGFCDQAVWIDKGRVVSAGDAKSVCERYYAFMQTEARGISNADASAEADAGAPPRDRRIADRRSASPAARQIAARSVSRREGTLPPGLQKIESFGFNLKSASHGSGDARILDTALLDASGGVLDVAEGGQKVLVRIHIEAVRAVERPIVGFIIKDRLGQPLIGGNTFHSYKDAPVSARAGEFWEVEFEFQLPILAVGDYSIVAAIANGTLTEHVHLHWVHDAFHFKVVSTSIDGVLAGVPLDRIDFVAYSSNAAIDVHA